MDKGQESPTDEGIGGIAPLRPFIQGPMIPRKPSPRETIPLQDLNTQNVDRMDRLDRLDSLQKIHAHSSAETSGLGDSLQRIHTLSSTETSGYGDTVPSPTGFDPSPVDPLHHGIPGNPRPSRSMLHINHPGGNNGGGLSPGSNPKPHMVAGRMKSASLDDDRYSPTKTHHMYPKQPPYYYGNPQMGTKRYPGNHHHNPGLVRGKDLASSIDRTSPTETSRRRPPSRQASDDPALTGRSASRVSLEDDGDHGATGAMSHHPGQSRTQSRASLREDLAEHERSGVQSSRLPRRRTLSRQSLQDEPYLERLSRRRPPSRQHSEEEGRRKYAGSASPDPSLMAQQHGRHDPVRRHHQSDGNLAISGANEHRYYADPYHPRPHHRRHEPRNPDDPYEFDLVRRGNTSRRPSSATAAEAPMVERAHRKRSDISASGRRRWGGLDPPDGVTGGSRRHGVIDQQHGVATPTTPLTHTPATCTGSGGVGGGGGSGGAICMSGGSSSHTAPPTSHHHQSVVQEDAGSSTIGKRSRRRRGSSSQPTGTQQAIRASPGADGGGGVGGRREGGGETGEAAGGSFTAASATYTRTVSSPSTILHQHHQQHKPKQRTHSPPPAIPSTSHGITHNHPQIPTTTPPDDDDGSPLPSTSRQRKSGTGSRQGRPPMTHSHKKSAAALDAGLDLSLYTGGTAPNAHDTPTGRAAAVGNHYPEVIIGVTGNESRRGSYTPTETPTLSRSGSAQFLGVNTQSTWLKWSQDRRNSFKKRLDVLEQRQKEIEKTRVSTPVRKARKESVMFVSPELESRHVLEEEEELDIHGLHTSRPGGPTRPPAASSTTEPAQKIVSVPVSRKKRLNAKEDVKLTVSQWNGLIAFWEHSVFVRCRYGGTLLSLLALILTLSSIGNTDWFRQTATMYTGAIYSGLWQQCSTTAEGTSNCTRLHGKDWQNAVIGLLLFAVAFGFLATILSICGACTTTLPKKIYYYHSAGEIYFICALSTTAALIVYPVAIETEKKMAEHQYGVGYGLGWGASFFFFAAAMCMCLDDLVRTIAKGLCCGKKDQSRQSRV